MHEDTEAIVSPLVDHLGIGPEGRHQGRIETVDILKMIGRRDVGFHDSIVVVVAVISEGSPSDCRQQPDRRK